MEWSGRTKGKGKEKEKATLVRPRQPHSNDEMLSAELRTRKNSKKKEEERKIKGIGDKQGTD